MAKECLSPNCGNPQFGGKRCRFHQYQRTDGKAPKLIKRTPLRKNYKSTRELDRFREIWVERTHKSFLTNKPINIDIDPDTGEFDIELFVKFFAHVLPKGRYSLYRLNKDNIILLLPYEHTLLDQGTKDQRKEYEKKYNCSFQIIYDLADKLRHTYNMLYNDNI